MGLAGQKTKQLISSDPRNTQWANDKSKFGYRMLLKMGWSDGKGLGLKETGQQDYVKITKKNDALGVGANRRTVDDWMGHNNAFNDLLASLNGDATTSAIDAPMAVQGFSSSSTTLSTVNSHGSESTSMASTSTTTTATTAVTSSSSSSSITTTAATTTTKGRLFHRSRFLQAKNRAVSNSKDLQEILGLKVVPEVDNSKGSAVGVESKPDDTANAQADTKKPLQEVQTKVSAMSMEEYFRQKVLAKRGLAAVVGVSKGNSHGMSDPKCDNAGDANKKDHSEKDDRKKRKREDDVDGDATKDKSGALPVAVAEETDKQAKKRRKEEEKEAKRRKKEEKRQRKEEKHVEKKRAKEEEKRAKKDKKRAKGEQGRIATEQPKESEQMPEANSAKAKKTKVKEQSIEKTSRKTDKKETEKTASKKNKSTDSDVVVKSKKKKEKSAKDKPVAGK